MISKHKILTPLLLIWFVFTIALNSKGQTIIPYTGPMPTPPANEKMLFYLQRTIDINTLVYEINYKENGQINKHKPVKIYWIDYANKSEITQLTFSQKMFAYGIHHVAIDDKETIFKINLVSYKKIIMYLKPSGKNGLYQTHITLNGAECILKNILIHITGGTYLKPIIEDIEVVGENIKSGKKTFEKFKPS